MSKKFSNILLGCLILVAVIILVLFYIQSGSGMYDLSNLAAVVANPATVLDGFLWWAYLLVGLTILMVLAFSIISMVSSPKSLKKAGITFGLAAVLIVVSYLLASGDPVQAKLDVAPTVATLKMTDTLLLMTYILFAVSVLILAWGAVRKMIQTRK